MVGIPSPRGWAYFVENFSNQRLTVWGALQSIESREFVYKFSGMKEMRGVVGVGCGLAWVIAPGVVWVWGVGADVGGTRSSIGSGLELVRQR